MAEEDLIFGKNQHFFGGMEPSTMIAFNAVVEDGMIKINAQLPNDTIVNGYSLCTVAGAVIRRRSDDYPVNEFDGDLVSDITTSGTFADSTADPTATYFYAAFPYTTQGVYSINKANQCVANGPEPMVAFSLSSAGGKVTIVADLPDNAIGCVIRKSTVGYPTRETDGEEAMTITADGTYEDANVIGGLTYYYSAFPYTASGIYSRDPADRASIVVATYYLFGYDLDTADSDPDTRVSYPSDVDNATFAKAYMDFSSGSFNYGGWNIAPGEKFMPKPCMLKYDGTVDYYLNPNDYGKKEDGSASDVANTSYGGNAMMEWPKIYTKRWEENGIYHFRCSDEQIDSDWDCWCNYDKNDNQIDHFYTSIYTHSVYVSGSLRSISGLAAPSSFSQTASNMFSYARNNGTDWCTEVFSDHLLIQDLIVLISKSTNAKSSFGRGNLLNPTKKSTRLNTGLTDTKGMFWGSTETYGQPIKVFGMENYWGDGGRLISGGVYNGSTKNLYVKLTRGTKDGSTVTDYNMYGGGYLNPCTVNTFNAYISSMKVENYGRIPIAGDGSATTYECDKAKFSSYSENDKEYRKPLYIGGGTAMSGTDSIGPFTYDTQNHYSQNTQYNYYYYGAGLSCKPSAT